VNLLIVNAGSSSVKVRVLDDADRLVTDRSLPYLGPEQIADALRPVVEDAPAIDAVGHRVVHGGALFTEPVRLDDRVDEILTRLADLAPLHNPPAIAGIRALHSMLPGIPQVACFDTSFHADLPLKAATYALPRQWREDWGLRRYGFHGLSHAWASRRSAELLERPLGRLRLVTAHLGAGASLAAVSGGRSVDTTMGFTPLEGLVMARRSGSVDPGIVLWVQRHGGLSPDEVETVLEHDSGLLGLSGISEDLREVLAAADSGHQEARDAYEVYVYRIQTSVAAMCAAMDGLDGLVFTGGAGQASPRLRADVSAGLGFLGVELDGDRNTAGPDDIISTPGGPTAVFAIVSREDLEIAGHVRELLGRPL